MMKKGAGTSFAGQVRRRGPKYRMVDDLSKTSYVYHPFLKSGLFCMASFVGFGLS
jgi:hypothetical protein